MARLQILELPEGSGDDRPPFVLVVDQVPVDEDGFDALRRDLGTPEDLAEQIGARAVLVFEDTIDIPANDTTADVGAPAAEQEVVVKLGDHDVRAVIAADVQKMRDAHDEATNVRDKNAELRAANEWIERLHAEARTARDALSRRKNELLDALGMDRTRDWDDIRNAAAGIRKERDAQAAELERLRAGEEPVTDERIAPTPAQWIWHWNRATPEKRLDRAAQIIDGMASANNCFMANHEAQITDLRAELERLRAKSPDA